MAEGAKKKICTGATKLHFILSDYGLKQNESSPI